MFEGMLAIFLVFLLMNLGDFSNSVQPIGGTGVTDLKVAIPSIRPRPLWSTTLFGAPLPSRVMMTSPQRKQASRSIPTDASITPNHDIPKRPEKSKKLSASSKKIYDDDAHAETSHTRHSNGRKYLSRDKNPKRCDQTKKPASPFDESDDEDVAPAERRYSDISNGRDCLSRVENPK